jgi:hypothetical protein
MTQPSLERVVLAAGAMGKVEELQAKGYRVLLNTGALFGGLEVVLLHEESGRALAKSIGDITVDDTIFPRSVMDALLALEEEMLVPPEGVEPPTTRLRAGCSTTELQGPEERGSTDPPLET